MALLWPLPVHHHHAQVGLITRPHMQSCLILLTARAVYSMTVTQPSNQMHSRRHTGASQTFATVNILITLLMSEYSCRTYFQLRGNC